MAGTQPNRITLGLKVSLTIMVALTLIINWVPYFDKMAQDYLSDTIASNAIVFGMVRTLNGVISVVQSADVGIGVASIGIGEILDPVNDLIERFSGLLLVTLTALGIQQVILIFTTSFALKVAFTACALTILLLIWLKPKNLDGWFSIILIAIFLRFLLNLEVGLIWLFDWLYFNASGQEALSILEATTKVVENLKETITNIDIGQLIFGKTAPELEADDISSRIAASVVTLIVGILFKSILIPIGTVWAGLQVVKLAIRTNQ